ncbi:fatty acyl-CoA synthetase [Cavenderia fasciculata]|uniref:Fatty acyl-CoA synthetase n=1 Tax=Cavenderia fasciculata TaxID=261658 RepID=F4PV04_CACFS|nr:fatty acyl-CoA synthetase [Cavenderia fasciculata]EGG21120.1 fatty acyl-CoA synthetase [Cavenderia fasciculata]|eukprot:XP_004358970.1 fatty acyl-CoA synthetase [Cavenderia fasciculata]
MSSLLDKKYTNMLDSGSLLAVGLVLVSGLLAYSWKRPHPYGQTIEVGESVEGSGRARRNAISPHHLVSAVDEDSQHPVKTLYDSMMISCKEYKDRPCFGKRKVLSNGELGDWEFISYNEFKNRSEAIYQGLCEIGVTPKSKVGIFSQNRVEWLVLQAACFMQSDIIVSFYETLGVESLAYVSRHAEIEIAFCSKATMQKTREIALSVNGLKTIVCFDDIDEQAKQEYEKDDDLATIMYTSGTTGDPKGVMITHCNLIAVVSSVKTLAEVFETDCHYSYLPYAHILERVVVATAFHYGAKVGIFCGDTTKILTEVKTLKPTIFIGVPRVFERIKTGVFKEIAKKPAVTRALFSSFYKLKHVAILYGFKLPIIESLINLIVFNKLKDQLGGKVRVILSGGAPLSLDTELFLRVCFSCSVIQGYGLTETCGGTAVKLLHDESFGSLGPPLTACEIKLVDVPELNYVSNGNGDPTGEVCIRGPSVAIGYYKDEAKTKQDYKDGWFHTGDIGRWNASGSLSIIDRKKNIFKLSQGEYVAVEKIENNLSKSEEIAQICVYGDSQKSCLIAIVHPHQNKAEDWAKANGVSTSSFKDICQNPKYHQSLIDDLNAVGRKQKLFGFEIPKKLIIIDEEFSDKNDMMTPSFKLKRPQIKDRYSQEIKNAYQGLE